MTGDGLVVAYALDRYHQSSQTFVDLEIQHLRRAGHSVHVLALRRGSEDRSGTDPLLRYLDPFPGGARTSFLQHLRWVRHPLRYARFLSVVLRLRSEMGVARQEHVRWWRLPEAAERLSEQGVQHVHTHFGWSGAASAACLSALLGVPWSMTLHARDIFSRQHNLAQKVALADLVVTVCDFNRRWLRENVHEREDIAVLTCGIEPTPVEARSRAEEIDVVAVARLVPKKGLDVLIRAAAELAARGRSVNVEIIGDGPEQAALEDLVRTLGLERVRFAGPLPHDEALVRIARARVFALPCRVTPDADRDAMPTVIIEAMMRGVPVVASDVGGIPEMVDDSVGRLVPQNDPIGVAAALESLLEDDGLRQRLGETAAARARERFDAGQQTRRLAELFGQVRR